jgi:hypothetical protein
MITISKGDIFFEPLGFLAEFAFRIIAKALSHTFPPAPLEQWGWPQWLWVFSSLATVSLIAWALLRRSKKSTAKRLTSHSRGTLTFPRNS